MIVVLVLFKQSLPECIDCVVLNVLIVIVCVPCVVQAESARFFCFKQSLPDFLPIFGRPAVAQAWSPLS